MIQTHQFWRDKEKNLQMFESLIAGISEKTDLVVLPEMFTTSFTIQPEGLAEKPDEQTSDWLREQSAKLNCAIMGSYIVQDSGKYFNRMVFVFPDGKTQYYNKRHLFRMAKEDQYFQAGEQRVVINYLGWKILPMICYDLRFPVWMRNRYIKAHYEYDLIVVVANWPAARSHPWKILLTARAMENQCYVVGVNRIGLDDNGISYSGDSMAIDPFGNLLSTTQPNQPSVETVQLSKKSLIEYRNNFTLGQDWEEFEIR